MAAGRKTYNALTDDAGQKWEFTYSETTIYEQDENEQWQQQGTSVFDFRYRKEEDDEWLALPSWADVNEQWKITLCFFDEDEETEEMTFWPVTSGANAEGGEV